MAVWNKKQQEVLNSIDDIRNILVSAAAGSGKTAVLVERIIETVETGRAGIDEILVVTFTKAAAAQMKGKIIKSLEKKVSEGVDDRLAEQLMIAESADIMTIDSFCNKIVRENFNLAGMDPSFEIYDADEVKLLKDEVLDAVMSEYYRKDDTAVELAGFLMAKNIDDSEFKDTIQRIVNVCESFADPERWIDSALAETYEDNIQSNRWIRDYKNYIQSNAIGALDYLSSKLSEYEQLISQDNGDAISKLIDMYSEDIRVMNMIAGADGLSGIKLALPKKWPSFPAKKLVELFSEEYVAELKAERENIKGLFKTVFTEDDIRDEIEASAGYIRCILGIVSDYRALLMEEKNRLKRYEFSDIAHAAYRILYDTEKNEPTAVGRRMSEQYKYIYIDEYQDSSDLQENILNSVARYDADGYPNNVFMVGDVKQSIYRFRLARPELFTEKADRYKNDDHGRLINLNMNYRSREEILDATNYVMKSIMKKSFGGIEYDDEVALNKPDESAYNDNYPEADDDLNIGGKPSLYMINVSDDEDEDLANESGEKSEETQKLLPKLIELTKDEIEAIQIGNIIKEIVEGNPEKGIKPVYINNEKYDSKKPVSQWNQRFRKAGYGDIVILQRAIRGSNPMVRIYEQMGIPVSVEDPSGYFDAIEIMTMISVLRVIDNIQQDIPLASVLLSHIGGLSDIELATVVSLSADRKLSLADKCMKYISGYKESADDELKAIADKLGAIFDRIKSWSTLRPYISIASLIERILNDTEYDCFVAAMPNGKRRVKNLKLLKTRAEKYEVGRNAGLMDFVRYIDKCAMNEMDFSEAEVLEDAANTVHITSIHRSKGLEYPIVIVARMGKEFMLRDTSKAVVVDSDYHLAMDRLRFVGDRMMFRQQSVKKSVVKLLSDKSTMTEEARLLYVAMTRAKEKLIMVGTYKKKESPLVILNKSMMGYIRYAIRDGEADQHLIVRDIDKESLTSGFIKKYSKKSTDYTADLFRLEEDIIRGLNSFNPDEDTNPYGFKYPFAAATTKNAKMSVSDIKHEEMEKLFSERAAFDTPEAKKDASKDNKEGALRGTITHYLFEKLDYSRVTSRDGMIAEFDRILNESSFNEEERQLINKSFVSNFYNEAEDSLYTRMKRAYLKGTLYREKQFVTGMDAGTDDDTVETAKRDFVVVQGVIDAFFYEDDDIVLVDYKTDAVKTPQELLDRYASQMHLYATTLEKITGHRVKDVILYSTRLGEVDYPDWRDYTFKRSGNADA